jgi:uncharacterized protein
LKRFENFYSVHITLRLLLGIIASILISYIVYYVLMFFGSIIFRVSYTEFRLRTQDLYDLLNSKGTIYYMLFIQSITIFIIPTYILSKIFQRDLIQYWNLNKLPSRFFIFIVVQIIICNIPGMNFWGNLNMKFVNTFVSDSSIYFSLYTQNEKVTNYLLTMPHFTDLFINIIFIAAMPAICEEFFFRGMIQRYALRAFRNKGAAIIITAIIFSIMHGDIYNFLPRFCMGIIFGYLFEYTQNIWIPIIAHFTHNAIVVLIFYFIQHGFFHENMQLVGIIGNGLGFGIASVVSVAMFMTYVMNNQKDVNFSEKSEFLE